MALQGLYHSAWQQAVGFSIGHGWGSSKNICTPYSEVNNGASGYHACTRVMVCRMCVAAPRLPILMRSMPRHPCIKLLVEEADFKLGHNVESMRGILGLASEM